MLNEKLVKKFRKIILVVGTIVIFLIGYLLGDAVRKSSDDQIIQSQNASLNLAGNKNLSEITKDNVQDFLIAFYTKKDLGENRERYKAFLTDGMYKSVVADEEKASTKAYQGYVVDWEYEGADIYINQEKKEVLVNVKYKNTTLAVKDDRSKSTIQTNESTYKLTYVNVKDKLLINKMEQLNIKSVERK